MYVTYILYIYTSSCYGSIPLVLGLIGRDSVLSTLCHSCGFACQKRVLKKFSFRGSGSLTMASTGKFVYIYIYLYIYIYIYIYIFIYIYIYIYIYICHRKLCFYNL